MRARAKEKLPSPIKRILSVERKGIVGRGAEGADAFAFALPFVIEGFPLPLFLAFWSATWAAWDPFRLTLRRDC